MSATQLQTSLCSPRAGDHDPWFFSPLHHRQKLRVDIPARLLEAGCHRGRLDTCLFNLCPRVNCLTTILARKGWIWPFRISKFDILEMRVTQPQINSAASLSRLCVCEFRNRRWYQSSLSGMIRWSLPLSSRRLSSPCRV